MSFVPPSKHAHTPSKGLRPDFASCPPLTRQQVASSSSSSSSSSYPSSGTHCASSITRDLVMEDRADHHQNTSYGERQVHNNSHPVRTTSSSFSSSSSPSSLSSTSCAVSPPPPPHEPKLSRVVSDPNHSHSDHRKSIYHISSSGDLKPYHPSDWIDEEESEFDELLMRAIMPESTTTSSRPATSPPREQFYPNTRTHTHINTHKDASSAYCSYPPNHNPAHLTGSTGISTDFFPVYDSSRYTVNQGSSHMVSPGRPGPLSNVGVVADRGSDSVHDPTKDPMRWPIFKGTTINVIFLTSLLIIIELDTRETNMC